MFDNSENYDDYEDLKDFIEDDDGGGYFEDMRKPDALDKYAKRTKEDALKEIERGFY